MPSIDLIELCESERNFRETRSPISSESVFSKDLRFLSLRIRSMMSSRRDSPEFSRMNSGERDSLSKRAFLDNPISANSESRSLAGFFPKKRASDISIVKMKGH